MFLYKNIEVSWKSIKSKAKVTMGTFLDLAHFSNYLQNKGNCMKTRWRDIFGTRIDMKFVRWIMENPHSDQKNKLQ